MAIDARIGSGQLGGVEQTIIGLAMGLSRLDDRGDRFLFLVYPDHDWLVPAIGGQCEALVVRRGPTRVDNVAARSLQYLVESRGRILPASDGTAERAGAQLIHFMQQRGFRTQLPSIYQPHDLLHLHHPEWFNPLQRMYRVWSYRSMARQASRVAVMTSAAREETARHLRVPESKVIVVPWASVLSLYRGEPVDRDRLDALGVPTRYLYFPARTWPHKNHVGLVRALALLRDEGVRVDVVCTGTRTTHWGIVRGEAARLGVEDLVHHLGFVDADVVRGLYTHATALIFPTYYEGWGLPVIEALEWAVPIACSDLGPVRDLAGPAALVFDPRDTSAIADAIRLIWTDVSVRDRLTKAASERAARFSWTATAALFRAHYRDVLRLPPRGDDELLLAAPPAL